METHVYLAGPDVFFPDAVAIGARKKAFLATLGLRGHFPFDNELPPETFADPEKAARAIADANESMMRFCCGEGRRGAILLNMIPFRGPSMDVGTAFEAGFMAALSLTHPDILIVGYTPDPRPFEQRTLEDFYKGQATAKDGQLIGADGHSIESFGGADNLMITAAIARSGGAILPDFESAARFLQDRCRRSTA